MAEDTSNELNITKIEYSTKYNLNFRPISNEQITTVEISPTGSGKTYFYENSPNTIMLMPTTAMVRQKKGMIAQEKAKGDERCNWDQLVVDKCEYMTYDKFHGHSLREDMPDINIIIDEAHIILASRSERHYELLRNLFTRAYEYKELKLISATLRPEVLGVYNYRPEVLQVTQYISTNFNPTIQFTKKLPKIDTTVKTLFFINSIDKMVQVKEYYEEKYAGLQAILLSADGEIPDTKELDKFDLILSTCVLKQGYSIESHIDQVIIHNMYNAVGAMDIIQYMARPRGKQPKVYVIPASTHFTRKSLVSPTTSKITNMLSSVANKGNLTDEQYLANSALEYNKFLAASKTSKDGWNILGVTHVYEKMIEYHELYQTGGRQMIPSIKSIIPKATVLIKDLAIGEQLSFVSLEIDSEIGELLECSSNLKDLLDNLKTAYSLTIDERTIKRLNRYKKNIPKCNIDFKMNNIKYSFTDACQVRQALEENVRSACIQHVKNTVSNVYTLRDKGDQRNRLEIGEEVKVSKLNRKLKFMLEHFNGDTSKIKLLGKMYCFSMYTDKGEQITTRSSKDIHSVKITSKWCVQEEWFELSNTFLKVPISIK